MQKVIFFLVFFIFLFLIHKPKRFFECINLQSFAQPTRHIAYRLHTLLLTKHWKSIKTIEEEYIIGFINHIEGEKDPRNLQIVLSLTPHITRNLNCAKHAEVYLKKQTKREKKKKERKKKMDGIAQFVNGDESTLANVVDGNFNFFFFFF